VQAVSCQTQSYFPKFYAPQTDNYDTRAYSITYSEVLGAVFSGGDRKDELKPIIMRTDVAV